MAPVDEWFVQGYGLYDDDVTEPVRMQLHRFSRSVHRPLTIPGDERHADLAPSEAADQIPKFGFRHNLGRPGMQISREKNLS